MGRVTQIPPRMSMPHPNTRSGALAPPMAVAAPALIAAIYAWAVFFTTFGHPGLIGLNYNAPGSDWMVLYEAARSAVSGDLPLIFDGDRFTAHLNATFAGWLSEPMPFRPWVYPPSFLLLLAPFAPLGFLASYAAFQLISGGLLGAALTYRAARPPVAGWLAAAVLISPGAALNGVDGACGLLGSALRGAIESGVIAVDCSSARSLTWVWMFMSVLLLVMSFRPIPQPAGIGRARWIPSSRWWTKVRR